MHGVPVLFESAYTKNKIVSLAASILESSQSFIYFNNTMHEAGYSNASHLRELLSVMNY
jgi:uncharacterized protein YecE (DUF72 family)